MPTNDEILRDLLRAKVAFQARTIALVLGAPPPPPPKESDDAHR